MTRKSHDSASTVTSKIKTTPIAIIGMGSIFPKARTTGEYWDNILRKIDCITDVPASRWSVDDYYDPNPSAPDKTYCKRGGFIPEVDFDPMEFGLPPNILEVTDVSQLISLVVAKEALEDARLGENSNFDREHTGCILGFVGNSSKLFTPLSTRLQYPVWKKVLLNSGISESDANRIVEKIKLAYVSWEENAFPGALSNVVSGRICNRFDLGGVNSVVDAACASSLSALKMAVSELIEGRANIMLAGGVDTDNSINSYMCFSKTPAFTQKENVRPFDAESGGMMVGEGLGIIVLKRLEDAERDGDRIYSVIRAIGTSSDGRFKSIYAPRPAGQSRAILRAYEEAGFGPTTVGLIEAHGTGTMAGDPAEFQGLLESFLEEEPRQPHIALGSVKSQIAHTKAAAGVASIIKTSLALYHKVLPPTINVTKPNPRLGIEKSPFYLNTETRPWIRAKNEPPRRAGVSSFGFGGTNFHVVLEEHESEQAGAYRLNSVPQIILLSASSPSQLLETCRQSLQSLQGSQAQAGFLNLARASRGMEIPQTSARLGFAAETVEEAREALQTCINNLSGQPDKAAWEHPKGISYRKTGMETRGKVVALFSGQGSQYLDMGRELALNFPVVRDVFAAMDDLFIADNLEPLSTRVYPRPVFDAQERESLADALTQTQHAQPAIGAVSVGLYKLLQQAGFEASFAAGHSFGELTALWAAGVISEDDYYTLAKARGKAMAAPNDPNFDAGTMMAVKGDVEKIREALQAEPGVTLANWNSNNQVVIAGSKPVMAQALEKLNRLGFQVIPLPVSAAFHTPLVSHAQKPFAQAIRKANFRKPKTRVFSNSTGKAHDDAPQAIRELLEDHILNPVLFRDEIENIYQEGGRIFVEFGPKNVLTNLVSSILGDRPHLAIALNANAKKDSDRQLREAVAALMVAGIPLGNYDPYAVEKKETGLAKKSPVTIRLHAGYYITEKTRSAFENALHDGFKISAAGSNQPEAPTKTEGGPSIKASTFPTSPEPLPVREPVTLQRVGVNPKMNSPVSTQDDFTLEQFQAHQSETARLHEQYLRTEEEYARAFAQMTALQTQLVSKSATDLQAVLPMFESLERSMIRFHEHQDETQKVHRHYLENQSSLTNSFKGLIEASPQPVLQPRPVPAALPVTPVVPNTEPKPTPRPAAESPARLPGTNGHSHGNTPAVPQAQVVQVQTAAVKIDLPQSASSAQAPVKAADASLSAQALSSALIEIVSEKTGYPSETLEMDMDLEADLGIDSIKRVEILGAMQSHFPDLPKVDAAGLAEMRTLGQIVSALGSAEIAVKETETTQTAYVVVETPAVSAPVSSPAVTADELTKVLLSIVSEKTGYPVETLELDMNMEADLGIDSIKRVEILGAIQNQFPDLPKVDATALAELCTLRQIIEQLGKIDQPSSPALVEPVIVEPVKTEQLEAVVVEPAGYDVQSVSTALLNIVSEKTGYPVETLELDMNLEADLGIDSIKRVEILGALQAQFPDLPKVDASILAELCSLGQIIDHMSQAGQPAAALPPVGGAAESPFDFEYETGIGQDLVIRKILPPPDRLRFDLPVHHACIVTDDGSPVTPAVVDHLLKRGWPVSVLRFPQEVISSTNQMPGGADVLQLSDLSEEALQACLAESSAKNGAPAVYIYLAAVADRTEAGFVSFPENEKALLKMVFITAKHLMAPLTSAAQQGRAVFMTVTRLDGQFGLSGQAAVSPVVGGLFGLVKSLNLEWDAVFCRAVDLSPELDTQRSVECILDELDDPNALAVEVGYTQTERSTLDLASLAVPVTGRKPN